MFIGLGGQVVRWCWVNFQCRGVLLIWVRVGQGPTWGCMDIFVAPALAGRHRRASFRPSVRSSVRTFVRPSIRQHLTWVSCERNSSYSFAPIVLKLCMCFLHCMRICLWIGHNCWISFCHFFDIVNLVIFHPDYIDRRYLLWAQLLLQFCTNCFETLHVFSSWYEDVHVVWT